MISSYWSLPASKYLLFSSSLKLSFNFSIWLSTGIASLSRINLLSFTTSPLFLSSYSYSSSSSTTYFFSGCFTCRFSFLEDSLLYSSKQMSFNLKSRSALDYWMLWGILMLTSKLFFSLDFFFFFLSFFTGGDWSSYFVWILSTWEEGLCIFDD